MSQPIGTTDIYLAGFENNGGKIVDLNFILSDGKKTKQKDVN